MIGATSPAVVRFALAEDHIRTADGTILTLIGCDDVDLLAVEPWRRDAAVDALGELLRGAANELLFMIRVRRLADASAAIRAGEQLTVGGQPGAMVETLSQAMAEHWERRLAAEPVYRRRVVVGVRGRDHASVERDLFRVAECLAVAGVTGERLAGDALRGWLDGVAGGGRAADWWAAPSSAQVGETRLRAMILDRLPGAGGGPGWLAPLLRCEADCDISVHLAPEVSARAMGILSRRMRDLGAHRLLEGDRGAVPDAGVEAGLDAARQLRDRLARNLGRPLRLWISGVARGDDTASLTSSWARLQAAFAATLGVARPAHFEHLRASLAAWGLEAPTSAGKLVDSQTASGCVPWLQTGVDDGDGYRIGRMADSGLPVRVAPFSQDRYANANIGVFAASGQGKSFLIGGLLVEAHRQGVEAIVVDPEGEYRSLIESLGGTWLDLVDEAAINPFEIGEGESAPTAAVVDVCALLCGGITDLERAAVDLAAREARARAGERAEIPKLPDCLPRLRQSAPRVAVVVDRFVSGSLAGFLGRPTAPAWQRPLLAVGHRDLREELVPVTTLLLGRHLWQLVRERPRRRHIVLDEVGILTAHPALRQLLGQLARRCRKYGSSLVVATQNVQDLLRSDEGSVVASNCAIVFCGGHRAVDAVAMERAFGLTEAQRRVVERAPRGEFVLLAGSRRGAMRVDLPHVYGQMIRGG